jgi:hypothetical protein
MQPLEQQTDNRAGQYGSHFFVDGSDTFSSALRFLPLVFLFTLLPPAVFSGGALPCTVHTSFLSRRESPNVARRLHSPFCVPLNTLVWYMRCLWNLEICEEVYDKTFGARHEGTECGCKRNSKFTNENDPAATGHRSLLRFQHYRTMQMLTCAATSGAG